ncbi:MAG: tRNA preQ1(34) S-adenosylmethionine ribosyltransferase-isomerase QueA [Actinomycetota bacterium]|nr:tRNA preQ1(34) S-adenosylmethionine ribosyltransferase-isomerase QueA [Actinomycetota bacterium]
MEVLDYPLPEAAIAQQPVEPRDSARLLDATDGRAVRHRQVRDLPELVASGDLIVVNNSRVLPARLQLQKGTGGAAEVLLLRADPTGEPRSWLALVRPGRRLPPGTLLYAAGSGRPVVEVGVAIGDIQRRVRLLEDDVVDEVGTIALPPYIRQPLLDPERYQTVYADRPGSVAAPTAGLHLTAAVLDRCRERGAMVESVDLAVGLGTFLPVTAPTVEDHVMHAERYHVPERTWTACQAADRVIAVGTTTVRALETAAATGDLAGETGLYIHGAYPFAVVDVLLTNFHQPRSTLLLMLEAFCGPRWRELYTEALAGGYRFLSFGDAMVVARR